MKLAALLAVLLALVVLWPRPATATWMHWRPVPEAAFHPWPTPTGRQGLGSSVSRAPDSPEVAGASPALGPAAPVAAAAGKEVPSDVRALRSAARPSVASGEQPSPSTAAAPPHTGLASWYDDGPGMYGALPGFTAGTHEWASVCAFGGERTTCITVPVVTSCQCLAGTPRARIIDLSPDAFRQLAPLSQGLVRVTVEIVR